MSTSIGVLGINGRLGRRIAGAVAADPAASLAGGVVRPGQALAPGLPGRTPRFDDVAALATIASVLIDVSAPAAVAAHAAAARDAGTALVVGVTGLDAAAARALDDAARAVPVLEAANFAPGVTVLLALARRLGAALDGARWDAAITEWHHRGKRDAPSGTALALGRALADGRGVALERVAEGGRDGPDAQRMPGAVGFASLRAGAIIGEHALTLTAEGEQITVAHRAFDRAVFADGAVRAALWLAHKPAGRYAMSDVLGLA